VGAHEFLVDFGPPAGTGRQQQLAVLDDRRTVTISSFQVTSSMSISMILKFGTAALIGTKGD
jgi:hypothetical protein